MVSVWKNFHNKMAQDSPPIKHHVLDDKSSSEFKYALKQGEITFKIVQPYRHRLNIAEQKLFSIWISMMRPSLLSTRV